MSSDAIRAATMRDAEAVAALISDLGYPTSAAAMRSRLRAILSDANGVTLVAERQDVVVGVAGASLARYYEKDGLYARLLVLAVSPAARGHGFGRQLVRDLEAWSAAKGAREMFVNSGLHRASAHAFYERCGYLKSGYRFVKELEIDG